MDGKEDESGATATAVFLRKDMLLIAHIGDSSLVRDVIYGIPKMIIDHSMCIY